MALLIGQKVSVGDGAEATIESFLGNGGFGAVFKARRSDSDEFVAVKAVLADGLTAAEFDSLKNEAELGRQLDHPNINKILFFNDGQSTLGVPPYLVAEYANGGTLQALLELRKEKKEHYLPNELIAIFLQLAEGMEAINSRLVHRDLKPDNILVHEGRLKIADFGLSKVVGAATRTHTAKGVQHIKYMAPEAWKYETNTIQIDMYSMGVVFYELATLTHPYQTSGKGEIVSQWQEAHMFGTYRHPTLLNSALPANLAEVICKLLKKRPTDRYSTWAEVVDRINWKPAPGLADRGSAPSIDLSKILTKARVLDLADEAVAIEQGKKAAEEEALGRIARFKAKELYEIVQAIVNQVNKDTDTRKLILSEFDHTFFVKGKSGKLSFSYDLSPMVAVPQQNFFSRDGRVVYRPEVLKMDGKEVIAWGSGIVSPDQGFNLALVRSGDDIYGDWWLLEHEHNPLVNRGAGLHPVALTRWEDFARQVQLLRAMGIYQTKVRPLAPSHLLPYIEATI